jgi:hypothetical protein
MNTGNRQEQLNHLAMSHLWLDSSIEILLNKSNWNDLPSIREQFLKDLLQFDTLLADYCQYGNKFFQTEYSEVRALVHSYREVFGWLDKWTISDIRKEFERRRQAAREAVLRIPCEIDQT